MSDTVSRPLGCKSTRAPLKTAWDASVTEPAMAPLRSCAVTWVSQSRFDRVDKTIRQEHLRIEPPLSCGCCCNPGECLATTPSQMMFRTGAYLALVLEKQP